MEHHKQRKRHEVAAARTQEKSESAAARAAAAAAADDTPSIEVGQEEKALAKSAVRNLDANHDGLVTKEEFVEGALEDDEFLSIVNTFNGELIWGELLTSQ